MMEKPWEEEYYHEKSMKKRREILDRAVAEEGMSPENELRSKLLDARYGAAIGKDRNVDYFIRGWMNLSMIPQGSRSMRRRERDIKSVMDDWKFELASRYGGIGDKVLYEEFCNLTLAYIDLCLEDKAYGSVLLGIGKMNHDSLVSKIAADVYNIAYTVPEQLGIKKNFRLFTEAATAMLCEKFPDIRDEFMEKVLQKND